MGTFDRETRSNKEPDATLEVQKALRDYWARLFSSPRDQMTLLEAEGLLKAPNSDEDAQSPLVRAAEAVETISDYLVFEAVFKWMRENVSPSSGCIDAKAWCGMLKESVVALFKSLAVLKGDGESDTNPAAYLRVVALFMKLSMAAYDATISSHPEPAIELLRALYSLDTVVVSGSPQVSRFNRLQPEIRQDLYDRICGVFLQAKDTQKDSKRLLYQDITSSFFKRQPFKISVERILQMLSAMVTRGVCTFQDVIGVLSVRPSSGGQTNFALLMSAKGEVQEKVDHNAIVDRVLQLQCQSPLVDTETAVVPAMGHELAELLYVKDMDDRGTPSVFSLVMRFNPGIFGRINTLPKNLLAAELDLWLRHDGGLFSLIPGDMSGWSETTVDKVNVYFARFSDLKPNILNHFRDDSVLLDERLHVLPSVLNPKHPLGALFWKKSSTFTSPSISRGLLLTAVQIFAELWSQKLESVKGQLDNEKDAVECKRYRVLSRVFKMLQSSLATVWTFSNGKRAMAVLYLAERALEMLGASAREHASMSIVSPAVTPLLSILDNNPSQAGKKGAIAHLRSEFSELSEVGVFEQTTP